MGFKVADAYVAVTGDDTNLAADLRTKIEAAVQEASDGVEAKITLGLTDAAPEDLLADLDAAILLAGEDKEVRVGIGLSAAAPEELDADVTAAVDLAQEGAKVKVGIDPKSAQDTGLGLSTILIGAFTAAAMVGPAALLMGTATALVGVGALVEKSNAQIGADYGELATTAKTAIQEAVTPLTTDLEASVGILQQGVTSLQPQLKALFATVAPDAEAVAGAMAQFADDALPGIKTGMQDIAPEMSSLASDAGAIGSGLGGFFAGLGSGASGGSSGLAALANIVKQLLPDIGQIVGDLSNGLGPALQDVDDVAGPAAHLLTEFVGAVPPGTIRAAADAVTALFVAFQVGKLANMVEDGTSFLDFVKNIGTSSTKSAAEVTVLGDAEEVTAAKSGLMAAASDLGSKAMGGLSDAAGKMGAAGAIGLTIVAAGMLGDEIGKLSGVGVNGGGVPQLTSNLLDASTGSTGAQQNLDALASSMAILGQVSQGQAAAGLANVDQALSQLYATDPQAATQQFNDMAAAMKANGATTQQITADFPQYSAAVQNAANATKENTSAQTEAVAPADAFSAALSTQITALETQTQTLTVNTTAANSALPAYAQLSAAAVTAEVAYQGASSATSSYTQALDALYGKYGDTSQAQAALTTGLDGLTAQITKGTHAVDLSSAAGAKNFTAFNQVAQAGENYAEKLYTQTLNSGQATQALQNSATALDKVAAKAGLTTTQIQQLNTELYGVPNVKDIVLQADTSQASGAISNLQRQIGGLSQSFTINVNGSNVHVSTHAKGGSVAAGETSLVGEEGPEIVTFGSPGYVTPNNQLGRVLGASGATGAGGVTIQNLNITIPMQGIVDFTNPHALDVNARRMAVNIANALGQVTKSAVGAR